MSLFNIGDEVELLVDGPDGNSDLSSGMTGVIYRVDEDEIAVVWNNFREGHGMGQSMGIDNGWWVVEEEIKKIGNPYEDLLI